MLAKHSSFPLTARLTLSMLLWLVIITFTAAAAAAAVAASAGGHVLPVKLGL
jgi:hypothetical protein